MKHRYKEKFPVIYSLLLAVGLMSGIIFTPGEIQAEEGPPITSVDAPAPVLEPTVVNDNNDTNVLFDNTHGQTAGAADWVINGGFSDFGQAIADEGYYVKELRQTNPITYNDLKDYQVFVIPEANIPFKDSEQDAILQFINNGGSVFFIGDHYNADRNLNRWDATEVFNGYRRGAYDDPTKGMSSEEANSEAMQDVSSSDWLSDNFGVRFRFNALGDAVASDVVPEDESFGITENVDTVAIHAGATLAITDPTKVKGIVYAPEGVKSWGNAVDQGVYFNGGRDEGAYVAISKLGKGKAAFIGDSSPVEDKTPIYVREESGAQKKTYDGFKEQDDGILLTNLINWLAVQEDYTSFENQGIPLDEESPLLDMEDPEKSTEPESEPWSTPPAGYKWYDRTTFHPGSYGSEEVSTDPTYDVIHQDTLPGEMQTFAVRITGEKLAPFASESDFRLGLYLDGGMQVGQFSMDGKNWQSDFGYSDYFSLVADSDGNAEKDIYVRIQSGVSGDAHLRLKQGKSNVFTKDVTVDPNAEPEPLPDDNSPTIPELADIAQVRTMADNQQVTVEGVVTTKTGLWGASAFYIQDTTGGIYVFTDEDFNVKPGDIVKITATKTSHQGELELDNIRSLEKTGSSELPEAQVVSPGDLVNHLGELLTLEAVKITDLHQADNYGTTEFTAVSENGASVVVRLDNRTGTTFDDFPYQNEEVVFITGIGSQFKDTYQLKPRSIEDFALIDIDWIKNYVDKSNINPKGIKNAIHAKLNASKKNPKHLHKLIDFIQHQPTKHIPNDVKEKLIHFIRAVAP